jgi:hypothetical protein
MEQSTRHRRERRQPAEWSNPDGRKAGRKEPECASAEVRAGTPGSAKAINQLSASEAECPEAQGLEQNSVKLGQLEEQATVGGGKPSEPGRPTRWNRSQAGD